MNTGNVKAGRGRAMTELAMAGVLAGGLCLRGDTVTVAYTAVAGNCTPNPVFCENELNALGGSYGPMSQTLTMQNVDGTWRVSDGGQPAS